MPWQSIVLNNKNYSIKFVANDDGSWKVLLTNLIELWSDVLTIEVIKERSKKLNPLLSVEDLNLKDVIEQIFSNVDKHLMGAQELNVELKMPIDGGFFKFSLDFTRSDSHEFYEQVTKPLLLTSRELNDRQNFLIDLIKQKDDEIAEHKAEGSVLLRKNIETKPFSSEIFVKSIVPRSGASLNECWQTVSTIYSQFEKDGLLSVSESEAKGTTTSKMKPPATNESLTKPASSVDTKNVRKRGSTTTYTSDRNARIPTTLTRKQKKFINL